MLDLELGVKTDMKLPDVVGTDTKGVRLVVATANRTAGAVIRSMLETPERAARWVSRREAQTELAAGNFADVDVLLLEISNLDDVERTMASALSPSPAIIAITSEARPDLRSAAETLGFRGCLTMPVDPHVLAELTQAILEQSGRLDQAEPERIDDCASSVIDARALEDLAGLGGAEFVQDIVSQFMDDAVSLLRTLNAAMRSGDASMFRDQAHALRSCAANVGASGVYEACLELRGIEMRELAQLGETHMKRLETEVSQARAALGAYVVAAKMR